MKWHLENKQQCKYNDESTVCGGEQSDSVKNLIF